MDILGVTPLEVIIIVILGLVVFGPERLPEVGRFIGRMFARLLAWQQQSPEAQMIQQIRKDFDREILELRDEIVRARQQLDISGEAQQVYAETQALLSPKNIGDDGSNELRVRPAAGARAVNQPATQKADPPGDLNRPAVPAGEPVGSGVSAASVPRNQQQDATISTQAIVQRLETLQADMQALQAQLQARGLLDPDWGFPSQTLDSPMPQLEKKEVGV